MSFILLLQDVLKGFGLCRYIDVWPIREKALKRRLLRHNFSLKLCFAHSWIYLNNTAPDRHLTIHTIRTSVILIVLISSIRFRLCHSYSAADANQVITIYYSSCGMISSVSAMSNFLPSTNVYLTTPLSVSPSYGEYLALDLNLEASMK